MGIIRTRYTVWRPTSVLQYYAANYSSERITRLCLFHRTNNPLHLKVPQFEDHLNGRITSPIPSDRIRNVQSGLTTSLPEPINDSKLRNLKGDHHPQSATKSHSELEMPKLSTATWKDQKKPIDEISTLQTSTLSCISEHKQSSRGF